jgi:hypothetical protein
MAAFPHQPRRLPAPVNDQQDRGRSGEKDHGRAVPVPSTGERREGESPQAKAEGEW